MISKELLSKVLGHQIEEDIGFDEDDYILYTKPLDDYKFEWVGINIHTLAYKCKIWAFDTYKLRIETQVFRQKTGDLATFVFILEDDDLREIYRIYPFAHGNMEEPEAIFKACQWILDNKDS